MKIGQFCLSMEECNVIISQTQGILRAVRTPWILLLGWVVEFVSQKFLLQITKGESTSKVINASQNIIKIKD